MKPAIFSAFENDGKGGGLTIPAEGVGGSWIVKLPSQQFAGVPENEFSMMTVAGMIGMEVPVINLIDLDAIAGIPDGVGELKEQALVVSRFDRTDDGPVHTEDFARVFGVFPDDKYKRASYANIARVIGTEAGDAGAAEFIRRLVFSALIGNGDMDQTCKLDAWFERMLLCSIWLSTVGDGPGSSGQITHWADVILKADMPA